jgi:pyruvate/2-oxoglutarate/acetoin dehydrogenase E1 component/TPP-dependent pyruvate/acetoin dehydrogenase alpha subunit
MGTKTEAKAVNAFEQAECTIEEAREYLRQMLDIRHFEENLFDLLSKNLIRGASHLYAGQEAVAVGAISTLEEKDWITSTHRGHGHCYSRGAFQMANEDQRQEHINAMMAELCGRATGYSRGRGGSMHIADVQRGNLGATGIVGGNLPVATGAALSAKLEGSGQVVLCFFGEGAVNNGVFHESLNLAATWDLPIVFICENNLYAMSVPYASSAPIEDIASRACAYAIPGEKTDGMDVLAVRKTVMAAVERARAGKGPTLVEAQTYRWYGHSRSDPKAYRTREEEEQWRKRDPIRVFSQQMSEAGWLDDDGLGELEAQSKKAIEVATEFALESPYPDPSDLYDGLYAPPKTTESDRKKDLELRASIRSGQIKRTLRYNQAVAEALKDAMHNDPDVFIMGEDIGLYGGAYGATKGLLEEFGEKRVRDTPISEATIAGAGIGAAMTGMRPVAEIMYIDFTLLASDQIANQGAKNRYMFGGKTTVPVVIRTEGGAGRGIAAQHSQSLEAIWTHFPGIYVAMPATPYDAKGLLTAAIQDDNPVMFIEHKMLYGTEGPVPEESYSIPLGVADLKREGNDVSVITYSRLVLEALQAAETLAEEGISVEVLDLRTLKPLDVDAIRKTVMKTGRVVIAYEGYRNNGFGAELIAQINELAFDWLDAPIVRVAGADVPVPMALSLEQAAIPGEEALISGIHEVLR